MPTSILHILENQVLPWVLRDGLNRFLVAKAQLKQMSEYQGVSLIPKKIRGPRKGKRAYTFSNVSAVWPNDNLLETRAPMLTFVLGGQADLHCGDYIICLPEGYGLLIPGNVPRWTGSSSLHHLRDHPQRFSKSIHCVENSGSLHLWINHQQGNNHFMDGKRKILIHNSTLLRLLENIEYELQERRENNVEIGRRLLEIFLLALIRDLHEKRIIYSFESAPETELPDKRYDPITEAQRYIRDNLHERLTQDTVAQAVRLSRTQFIRRFREEAGQSFNQYITECRMNRAKELLRTTDFPLTFIRTTLGYKSATHFNSLFRKKTGMLPREFRQQNTAPNKETNNAAA